MSHASKFLCVTPHEFFLLPHPSKFHVTRPSNAFFVSQAQIFSCHALQTFTFKGQKLARNHLSKQKVKTCCLCVLNLNVAPQRDTATKFLVTQASKFSSQNFQVSHNLLIFSVTFFEIFLCHRGGGSRNFISVSQV